MYQCEKSLFIIVEKLNLIMNSKRFVLLKTGTKDENDEVYEFYLEESSIFHGSITFCKYLKDFIEEGQTQFEINEFSPQVIELVCQYLMSKARCLLKVVESEKTQQEQQQTLSIQLKLFQQHFIEEYMEKQIDIKKLEGKQMLIDLLLCSNFLGC